VAIEHHLVKMYCPVGLYFGLNVSVVDYLLKLLYFRVDQKLAFVDIFSARLMI